MSTRLYVGNLPKENVERQDLQEVFADAGDAVSIKVIKDRKTGKCRGFAFVTVESDELADELIEKHNGQSFMEAPLKIEKALPREAGAKDKPEGDRDAASEGGIDSGAAAPKRRSPAKKSKRGGSNNNSSGTASEAANAQPDPRWADQLAQLKEKLAAAEN